MTYTSTINTLGHYCGRFDSGFFGEPLNSFSSLAFVLGALYAWRVWRSSGSGERWSLVLFALAASIGVGSFIFHSMPTPATLIGDLVPIQVFGLAFMGFVALKYLRFSMVATFFILLGFFFARQFWVSVVPPGALGGGVTHVPTLVLLGVLTFLVRRRGFFLWRYMAAAVVAYVAALLVRSFDLAVCAAFPWGLHWAWHLLTATTASLLMYGIAATPPNPSFKRDA
ncbi:MAG: hypothetical protein ACYC3A_06595 [Halothiobacillus sp.]